MAESSWLKQPWNADSGEAANDTAASSARSRPLPAPLEPITSPPGLTLLHTLEGHAKGVWSMEWSPDGSQLASGSFDHTVRVWDAASGRQLHTLEGHTDGIGSVEWSPDGSQLASGSRDHTVRVWDAASGRLLHMLEGHGGGVYSMKWSPDGSRLASGSHDHTVRVWDAASGRLLHMLEGHTDWVNSVGQSPDGSRLASGSHDRTVGVWDAASGRLLHMLEGHTDKVQSVEWSPDGSRLASGSDDYTVRVWDAASGRQLHTLEGHTDKVQSVEWSPDGSRLASGSHDRTVGVWDAASGRLLHMLEGHTSEVNSVGWSPDGILLASASASWYEAAYVNGEVHLVRADTWEPVAALTGLKGLGLVAWHPRLTQLVTPGQREQDLLLWHLDLPCLLGRIPSAEAVHYKNAKVVLVGESGVGKSGLALVLTGQPFAPTESTHGRHIWLLDGQEVTLDGGRRERRETWLWDLAGQRDYRLIHQLHLHEATVALIVFDAVRDTDPLAGIRYWQHALHLAQQARGSSALPLTTYLVAARMDRGGRGVSREHIEALVQELVCAGYIETSAKTGQGIAELGQMLRTTLDWNTLPGVTSTTLLQAIKMFVLGEVQSGQLLRTVDELYQTFLRVSNIPAPDAAQRQQFEAVLGRLEGQGALRSLGFGNLVLLQAERLDAYASSLLIAVRNEPDGLGMIDEERVRRGQFAIPQEDRLSNIPQEQLLLLAMIEELVRHELVLREGGSLLFPSQSTREHPDLAALSEQQCLTFRFAGPVLSIYTTLVVRLAQSGLFQKQELWQHVITYTTRLGGNFGLLLTTHREEQADLGLFFDEAAREEMRFHFENFVQTHLERHAIGTVQRQRRFVCPTCSEVFTEKQVNHRQVRGFDFIRCSTCDTEISLRDGVDRLTSPPTLQVKVMEQAADTQRDHQSAVSRVEGKRATRDFDVFLCHNGQDKPTVKQIGEQLKRYGILPWLDEWELPPGRPWQRLLEEQIGKMKSAAVFVGKDGLGPWQHQEVDAFLREFAQRGCPVIPVVLHDAPQKPELPVFLRAFTWVDFRIKDPDPMQRLIWGITGEREIEE